MKNIIYCIVVLASCHPLFAAEFGERFGRGKDWPSTAGATDTIKGGLIVNGSLVVQSSITVLAVTVRGAVTVTGSDPKVFIGTNTSAAKLHIAESNGITPPILIISTGSTRLLEVTGSSISLGVPLFQNVPPADYVFEDDYKLMRLEEVKLFVEKNNHLPNYPSAMEMVGGQNLALLHQKMLEKLEEAYLYIFELESRLSRLEGQ